MSKNPEMRGGSDPIPRPSVAAIFKDIAEYNHRYVYSRHESPWAQQRIQTMKMLTENGLDRDAARRNIDAVEGQEEAAERDFTRQMIMMTHEQGLAESGLIAKENHLLQLYVYDGDLFCSALDTVEPTTELSEHLSAYFRRYLTLNANINSFNDDKAAILFDGEIPDWWDEIEDTSTAIEHQSVDQILKYTPFLADKLTDLGCDPNVITDITNVAMFAKDGDIFEWASAEGCELLQSRNTASVCSWYDGEIERDWRRSMNLLKMARPGGAFYNYFKQSLTSTLEIVSQSMDSEIQAKLHQLSQALRHY